MLKFEFWDKIRVKENGLTGHVMNSYDVISTNFPGGKNGLHYTILWDHYPDPCVYAAKDVDDLWEKVKEIKNEQNVRIPGGIEWIDINIDINNVKASCDHKWVNASLIFEKMCCYHCGVDKP